MQSFRLRVGALLSSHPFLRNDGLAPEGRGNQQVCLQNGPRLDIVLLAESRPQFPACDLRIWGLQCVSLVRFPLLSLCLSQTAMKLGVAGFTVYDSSYTNPNNTGSAPNTQIISFQVVGFIFIWILYPTYFNGHYPLFSYSSVTA